MAFSPWRLLGVLTLTVLGAEVVCTSLVVLARPLGTARELGLDVGLMLLLMFPALYFLSYRPLVVQAEERARAEDALRQANSSLEIRVKERTAALEATFDALMDAVMVVDATGRVTQANPAAVAFLGFDPKGVELSEWAACVSPRGPDHQPLAMEELASHRALRGETVRSLKEALTFADGRESVTLASASPLTMAGNPAGAVVAWHDITEWERTGKALRVALEKYRVLFDCFPLGITVSDAAGRIVESNRQAERLLELPQSDHLRRGIGTHEWRIVRPDGSPMPPEEYASVRALQGRQPVSNVEMGLVGDSGRVTWINVTAAPIPLEGYGVAIAYGDVTARRSAEDALRASEARFRSLYVSMTEGVALHEIVVDPHGTPEDYVILDINPAFERITGLRRESVVGRRSTQAYGTHEAPYLETYAKVAGSGEPTAFETYFPPMEKHFRISVFSPEPGKFATVFSDITERRRAEEFITASLREKELLLKEIHHRVKNNLQIIASMLSLQASQSTDAGELGALKESQDRIRSLALIHEKLYRSDDLARVAIRGYVEDLATYLTTSYRRQGDGTEFSLNIDDVFLGIDTAIPLALIINELVANSIKHAFPDRSGGQIWVELHGLERSRWRLIVADDGVGFPPDVDFRHTESLGLQIVCILVTQLDGQIELAAGPGTRFVITFGGVA